MASTIFERCGGFAVVSRVVMAFYDKVLDSDVLGPYFDHVEMKRLIDHQTKFVAAIMGGPASVTDERLRHVHEHLGIDRAAFREMVRLMTETLDEFGFARDDVDQIRHEIERRAPYILGIGPG
jgi:hemoglobin